MLLCRIGGRRVALADHDVVAGMVRDLLQRAFGGSVKALVLQALAGRKSTPDELAAMEELLDRFEASPKGKKP